jgi:hypothetical protein
MNGAQICYILGTVREDALSDPTLLYPTVVGREELLENRHRCFRGRFYPLELSQLVCSKALGQTSVIYSERAACVRHSEVPSGKMKEIPSVPCYPYHPVAAEVGQW